MMQGEIQVQSEYGKGTIVSFTCLLDRRVKEMAHQEDITTRENKEENTARHKKKIEGSRILVVEDNLVNQQIIRKILGKANLKVDIAHNGRMAVEALKKNRFDAVLMDIQMPEMDGLEATRQIRNDPDNKFVPIVALTANAMKGDEEKYLSAGMDGYISKPIDQAKLIEILSRLIK
jgi:CheY-like chemotaxis protein